MKRKLLFFASFALMQMFILGAYAQSSVSGKVLDENGEGLPGASVVIKGTSSGTITDLNGDFKVNISGNEAVTLQISFIGFTTIEKTVESGTTSLGSITMEVGANELTPLEIIASVAVERKTPVAVSTIKKNFIEENASNQEFPELLKTTPGIYATKDGGGYGDSRIRIRGFNDVNVAVLINGVPVNDMENGRVYWSNWAGLTDVTNSMQVQRGLGASKVAVPSIGGTVNIITQTTEVEKGGYASTWTGNDGFKKTAISLATGLTENGWAISVQGAKISGDGWADGLQFEGYNYFFNVSKVINDMHTLSLTGFGAPQRHGQRQNQKSAQQFRDAPQGLRFNGDWGVLDGDVVQVEDNFYHKPQISLNHYWTIGANSELSTALYASQGTGGGGGTGGTASFDNFRSGDEFSPYDLDAIVDLNQASLDGSAEAFLRTSRNDHNWYGILSTYTNNISTKINLLAGLDLRYYRGIHFSEVSNKLGADFVIDNGDINDPYRQLQVGDKRDYYNDGVVTWTGGFLQAEYSDGPLSAFVSLSGSNTGYQRVDYFGYFNDETKTAVQADADLREFYEEELFAGEEEAVQDAEMDAYLLEDQETDFVNFFGYQIKGGANYNLNRNHNVFANIGYFEKAPDFDAVFQNFQNDVNEDAENQKITSFEVGYGYTSTNLNARINAYRTLWKDRTFIQDFPGPNETQFYYANILGVNAIHQGVEVELNYNPTPALRISGMLSLGDWTWDNDVESVSITDEDQQVVGSIDKLYIAGLKVGDAAQTTGAVMLDYDIVEDFTLGLTFTHFSNLYADYDPINKQNAEEAGVQSYKVPDYNLIDAKVRYDFEIGDLEASVFGNVQNLFDVEYISDAQTDLNNVFFGFGRTWSTGLKVNF